MSVVLREIKATLLHVERLTEQDRRTRDGVAPDGLRIVWWIENRPGAAHPPVLGEVRVHFNSRLYNPVTSAASAKPFAPDMIIHDSRRFFERVPAQLQRVAPAPRRGAASVVVEVYVRGNPLPSNAPGAVELQLGDSTEAAAGGQVRFVWFRFRLQRFD